MTPDSPENMGGGYGPYRLGRAKLSRACQTGQHVEIGLHDCSGCDCACHGEEHDDA